MPKYRVKAGYHLIDGSASHPPGTVLELTEAFAELQRWKLDRVEEEVAVKTEDASASESEGKTDRKLTREEIAANRKLAKEKRDKERAEQMEADKPADTVKTREITE